MKLTLLIFLIVSIGSIHAATIESRPLSLDSNSPNKPTSLKKIEWNTNTKIDNKNDITQFRAEYQEVKSGITIAFVIPIDSTSKSAYFTRGDNTDVCEPQYIDIEFDKVKSNENKSYFSSGKVWVDNSNYFYISKGAKQNSDENYYRKFSFNPFKPIKDNNNIKITSDQTNDLYIPLVGAKIQIEKAENECLNYLKNQRDKLIAEAKKREIEVKAEREKVQAEWEKVQAINEKLNKETEARYLAQLKKSDARIGMTKQQVLKNTRWGAPLNVNSLTTKYGMTEQWTYWGYKYLYFTNGKLVAIQK
ncbi:hypothetical protein MJ046_06210 [Acinetobacter bereziniae]|uniref:hypothetical protein n=1 Tax=Acinetobacter bereziniae TaxID=106648 RepID=UPI0022EA93DB|nr:hypothetical protein [Acinetobacter bereziniae]MDA3439930.1 hypothetical protein [Acinetobacter bereziniae]